MQLIRKAATVSLATLIAWTVAGVASAQTLTATSTTTTTPGVPNTGAGGDVMLNVLLLAASAAVALIGLAFLSRRWSTS